jgi:hypothetical protein
MTIPREITNGDDVIDSRDVIDRIAYLEELRDKAVRRLADIRSRIESGTATDEDIETLVDAWTLLDGTEVVYMADFCEPEDEELAALQALAAHGEQHPGWESGVALIHDSHFEDYARQLAEDIGAIEDADIWPCNLIDWELAAEALRADYCHVDYAGSDYWMRS